MWSPLLLYLFVLFVLVCLFVCSVWIFIIKDNKWMFYQSCHKQLVQSELKVQVNYNKCCWLRVVKWSKASATLDRGWGPWVRITGGPSLSFGRDEWKMNNNGKTIEKWNNNGEMIEKWNNEWEANEGGNRVRVDSIWQVKQKRWGDWNSTIMGKRKKVRWKRNSNWRLKVELNKKYRL